MNALIVVDIQNDFLPGGALAVTDGDQIIPIVNELMKHFDFVIATQDWHPADHKSFASNHPNHKPGDQIMLDALPQILWPAHCVQHTFGADFAKSLLTDRFDKIIQKGTNIHVDSYSGFFDNGKKQDTGLHDYLVEKQINEVYVVGLATDYCVKFTALDAYGLGLKTTVISDATRAVNLCEGDFEKSLEELKAKGIEIRNSIEFLAYKKA